MVSIAYSNEESEEQNRGVHWIVPSVLGQAHPLCLNEARRSADRFEVELWVLKVPMLVW